MKRELSMKMRAHSTVIAALASIVLATGCLELPDELPATSDPTSLRVLGQGEVIGFATDPDAHAWQGIPFASAPVGDLRWRAPRSPNSWDGTLEALAHGPSCIQFAGPGGGRDGASEGEVTGSEDCLYLNVYAPRFAAGDVPTGSERLPVMFWIHGGGNTIGDATMYDGSMLAADQQVIAVTVHYRLGTLGWFAHPSLRGGGTTSDDRSGNYGTLDLVRGLEWVQENIAAFGGDPNRVTVFGESAGGSDTFSMLLSSRAAGLFHRAIVESGGTHTSSMAEAQNFVDDPDPGQPFSSNEVLLKHLMADGRATDRTHAKTVLAGMKAPEVEAYLRGMDAEDFLSVFDGSGMAGMYRAPELLADGRVLPSIDPILAFEQGLYNKVPTIMGTNRDENRLFSLFSSEHVTKLFGALPLWFNNERLFIAEADYQTRMWKVRGVDEPAKRMRETQGASVFAYRFDWDEEGRLVFLDLSKALGAAHGLEIPFVFGWLSLGPVTEYVYPEEGAEANKRLASSMMSYWGQFAYTGDPGSGRDGSLPKWGAWSNQPDAETFIIFDSDRDGGIRMSSQAGLTRDSVLEMIAKDERFETDRQRCALYYSFVQWGAQLSETGYESIDGGACASYPLSDYPWKT